MLLIRKREWINENLPYPRELIFLTAAKAFLLAQEKERHIADAMVSAS